MKKGLKIVTIGGGSSYTPELVEGFIKRYDELPVKELWLVDIEEGKEKLEIVGNLAKRMVKEANVDMEIHLTLDRQLAIKDADFVTTQFRVGLLDARILDEEIPSSHGMLGQETNGAGGVFKAMRTIPIIFDIIDDVKKYAKNAWIINFTNPAGIVSEAVFRHTDFNHFIGICNVPINQINHFATLLNKPTDEFTTIIAGLNHMSYTTDVLVDNKSVLDELILKMKTSQANMKNIDDLAWDINFIKNLGCIPSPYHKYFYNFSEMLEHNIENYKKGETRGRLVKKIEKELFAKYKDPFLKTKPVELEQRGGALYSDAACNIISSIYHDKGDMQVVNTKNIGAIKELDDGCAIEVSCTITKDGPIPFKNIELPNSIIGLIQDMKRYEYCLVDAIKEKDKEKALLALQINPLTFSYKTAEIVFNELLIAHKKYLTYFK